MRLVIIGPTYPFRGGISHYTTKLARALSAHSSQVDVVSFRRQFPRWLYPGNSDRDPSREPLKVQAEYLLDPLYPWTWWQAAAKIVAREPDLVIFQWWSTFWAPAYFILTTFLHRHKIKTLYIIHNVLPHERRPWDLPLARLALRNGDYFLVHTERERSRLLSFLPGAITTLAPLPPFDMFKAHPFSRSQAKETLGLDAQQPVILDFGLVRPYKGLKYALEALALLNARSIPFQFVIAGEFWEDVQSYARLIDKLGLSSRVRIDNRYIPDEEVNLYFSAADVYLAPYIGGTQSGAVKIAISYDLPIVISRAIASLELENDKQHRFYWVAPADAQSLAEGIELCLREKTFQSDDSHSSPEANGWDFLAGQIEALR